MARKGKYTTNIVLAVLVLGLSGLVWWSSRQVPDSVREERQSKLLPALRRENVSRMEFTAGAERFTVAKDGGHWALVVGAHRYEADEPEIERVLTEAEFASPTRRLGTLDAASRERFGLTNPRARVTLREAGNNVAMTFAIGGLVAGEQSAYVEFNGAGFVVPTSLADAFVRRASELRDRTLSTLEPSRLARLEVDGGQGGRRVYEQAQGLWRLTTPAEGRVARVRMESLLHDLRDMRATRYLVDEAGAAAMQRAGLQPARVTVSATRTGGGPSVVFRFGGPCSDYHDEVAVSRNDSRAIACVGRSVLDNVDRQVEDMRDDRLVWARADEVERVRVHTARGEFSIVRDHDHWRMDGAVGEVDSDSVDAWLNGLGSFAAETRLAGSDAAAHGLLPATTWIEISRTGVDGAERIDVGSPDADRMYASRAGEPVVLGLDPSAADSLRIDAARFRSRQIVRDVPDELTGLVTDGPAYHDEATRIDGTWRVTRPVDTLGDPAVIRTAAERLATLDAERWVSLEPLPVHGLAAPRFRVVARFEGDGPDAEPGDAGVRGAGRARVREFTLAIGALAPGGGAYASISSRNGVFVLGQNAIDELTPPRIDRNLLEVERDLVVRIELTRGTARLTMRRDGTVWRTEAGAPVERTRVTALLERVALVRAPRAFGYGPAPAGALMGRIRLAITVRRPGGDGGFTEATQTLSLGALVGSGLDAVTYARRDGLDATLSVAQDVATAIEQFEPAGVPADAGAHAAH